MRERLLWYPEHYSNVVIPSVARNLLFSSVIPDLIGDPVSLQWHLFYGVIAFFLFILVSAVSTSSAEYRHVPSS